MVDVPIHRVLKVGDSLAVSLPAYICRGLGIERGDLVSYSVVADNEIIIKKLTSEDLKVLRPNIIA